MKKFIVAAALVAAAASVANARDDEPSREAVEEFAHQLAQDSKKQGMSLRSVRVTGRGASLEGDHVCAAMERAITQQPADRGGINVVGASDISLRLASGQPLQCFLPLMRRQLARPTEPNTALLRSLAALARPSPDQLTLELSQATKHGQHQPTVGARGIGPSILEALEAGATIEDGRDHVEQVAR